MTIWLSIDLSAGLQKRVFVTAKLAGYRGDLSQLCDQSMDVEF